LRGFAKASARTKKLFSIHVVSFCFTAAVIAIAVMVRTGDFGGKTVFDLVVIGVEVNLVLRSAV
jgi:hypothetical protein